MKYLAAMLLLCISTEALATDINDVKFLKTGDQAPFTGYLITPEKADKVHDLDAALKSTQKINSLLLDEQKIYEQRLSNSRQDAESLSKEVQSQRESALFTKIGFFILGAAVTTGLAFGVSRATR